MRLLPASAGAARGRNGPTRPSRCRGEWRPQPAPRSVRVPLRREALPDGRLRPDRARGRRSVRRRARCHDPRRRAAPRTHADRSSANSGSTAIRSMSPTRARRAGSRPACGRTRPIDSTGYETQSVWPRKRRRRCAGAMRSNRSQLASPMSAPSGHPVVTNSWVLNYLTSDERRSYLAELERIGAALDLSWVFAEAPGLVPELPIEVGTLDIDVTALTIARWRDGRRRSRRLPPVIPTGTGSTGCDAIPGCGTATGHRRPW